jgi:catechol 2,3-dioxygenase-like lactoylglutathione lyase family enzyme
MEAFSEIEFIFYVADQQKSRDFYSTILRLQPVLDVVGMTEFQVGPATKLGLMPEAGIAKIIGNVLPHPSNGSGIPRAELYLYVDDVRGYFTRALQEGAQEISAVAKRGWGDTAAYVADPDGHILAFASKK